MTEIGKVTARACSPLVWKVRTVSVAVARCSWAEPRDRISLVGWAYASENKSGLRYSTDADKNRLTETERTAGHMMCAHYSGAVDYHQGNTDVEQTMDRRQLPDFTLEFVTNLSTNNAIGDCAVSGVSGPTRRTAVRRDGHCE